MTGLFETIRIRDRRIPFLAEHLARLGAGLWRLSLEGAPPGLEHRLRSLAHLGEGVLRVTIDASGEKIETRAVPETGAFALITATIHHRPYPLKSTERAIFDQARSEAEERGAGEALLITPEGYLAEGAITSLFFWSDELLCTPDLGLGILPGIGRARVIALARSAGLPIAEGRFAPAALEGASLFLTNAVRGIIEVAALDGVPSPVDPRTRLLGDRFWD